MHKQIRERLNDAEGESEFVIAVDLDIRGFSAFSMRVDAVEAAQYLKSVYLKLLDDYFEGARFFKLTGDGLMLTFRYSQRDLAETAAKVLGMCQRALAEFSSLTAADPMVNFEVPSLVGIGVARGAACRIRAGRLTLDYSGRVLNLAARLMSLARPSGLVIDSAFGPDLIPEEISTELVSANVFLPGIAEEEPIAILHSAEVDLPPSSRVPIRKVLWRHVTEEYTLREWRTRGPRYAIDLPTTPQDPARIEARATWITRPATGTLPGIERIHLVPNVEFAFEGEQPQVRLTISEMVDNLRARGAPLKAKVKIDIAYPARARRMR